MDFVNFFANIGIPPDPVANEDTLRNHIGRIPYNTFQVSPVPVLNCGGGGGGCEGPFFFFFLADGVLDGWKFRIKGILPPSLIYCYLRMYVCI